MSTNIFLQTQYNTALYYCHQIISYSKERASCKDCFPVSAPVKITTPSILHTTVYELQMNWRPEKHFFNETKNSEFCQKELITKVTEGSGFGKIIISIFSNK
jgi:hypothetical protein